MMKSTPVRAEEFRKLCIPANTNVSHERLHVPRTATRLACCDVDSCKHLPGRKGNEIGMLSAGSGRAGIRFQFCIKSLGTAQRRWEVGQKVSQLGFRQSRLGLIRMKDSKIYAPHRQYYSTL